MSNASTITTEEIERGVTKATTKWATAHFPALCISRCKKDKSINALIEESRDSEKILRKKVVFF